MKMRFVGDYSTDGQDVWSVYGQPVEMPEDRAFNLVLHQNIPLIPEEDFPEFSPEELKQYPNAESQNEAPKEFLEKRHAALMALSAYRQKLAQMKEEGTNADIQHITQ